MKFSFISKIPGAYVVVLVTGTLENNIPFYAYLKVEPQKLAALEEASKKGNANLEEYGEILFHDYAPEPPPEVQAEAKALFVTEDIAS